MTVLPDSLEEVVARVVSQVRGVWRRRWWALAVAGVLFVAAWWWIAQLPPQYEAKARVYVNTQSLLQPLLGGMTVRPNVNQQIDIMTRTLLNRPNLEKVARTTDLDIRASTPLEMEALLSGLSRSIRFTGSGRDNLFTISYQHRDPETARRVVQAVLTLFVESSLGDTRKDIVRSQRFIDEQLKAHEARLVAAESALTAFKREHVGIMPGEGGDYYKQLSEARMRLEQANLELRQAERQFEVLHARTRGDEPVLLTRPMPPPLPGMAELEARIDNVQKRLDELLIQYTEMHPDVVAARRMLAQLRGEREAQLAAQPPVRPGTATHTADPYLQQLQLALATSESQIAGLRTRVEEYQARYSHLQTLVDRIPQIEADYVQLTRDYRVYKNNYEKLLETRETAALSGEMERSTEVVDFRVIDPPRLPLTPAAPNPPLLLSGAFVVALGAGVGFAFLLAMLRRTVDDARMLRALSGRPMLGIVAYVDDARTRWRKRAESVGFVAAAGALVALYGVSLLHFTMGLPGWGSA